jgi:signal transduction histidine kinase
MRASLDQAVVQRGIRRVAAVTAVLAVLLDAITRVELDIAGIYCIPLVFAALGRGRRLLWVLVVLLTTATFWIYASQITPGAFELQEAWFVNRVIDVVALWVTGGVLHIWIGAAAARAAQGRLLQEQNEELERRRREAEEASGRKSQLLASASHDIRTPVNAINLMAQIIARTAEDPALCARIPHLAQRLQANAASLVDLVSNLLDIGHFDSGKVVVHETVFELNELVTAKCRELLPLAQARGLALEAETAGHTIWLRTDRIKLSRVLANLISNGIKFTDRGGVTVTVTQPASGAPTVRVRDTGPGVPADQVESIFREFSQIGGGEGDAPKGWGLGLAICRRLVTLLGGSIAVTSETGRGSVFTVCLPARCVAVSSAVEPLAIDDPVPAVPD